MNNKTFLELVIQQMDEDTLENVIRTVKEATAWLEEHYCGNPVHNIKERMIIIRALLNQAAKEARGI